MSDEKDKLEARVKKFEKKLNEKVGKRIEKLRKEIYGYEKRFSDGDVEGDLGIIRENEIQHDRIDIELSELEEIIKNGDIMVYEPLKKDLNELKEQIDELKEQIELIKLEIDGLDSKTRRGIERDNLHEEVLWEFMVSTSRLLGTMYNFIWSINDNKDANESMKKDLVRVRSTVQKLTGEKSVEDLSEVETVSPQQTDSKTEELNAVDLNIKKELSELKDDFQSHRVANNYALLKNASEIKELKNLSGELLETLEQKELYPRSYHREFEQLTLKLLGEKEDSARHIQPCSDDSKVKPIGNQSDDSKPDEKDLHTHEWDKEGKHPHPKEVAEPPFKVFGKTYIMVVKEDLEEDLSNTDWLLEKLYETYYNHDLYNKILGFKKMFKEKYLDEENERNG